MFVFTHADDGEFLDLYLKSFIQQNYVYKEPCVLKEKMKSKMELNSECLFELALLHLK